MRRHRTFLTLAVWICGAVVTLVAGVGATIAVGEATNSGLLGICGPYGPAADLMGWMLLGSVAASLGVGTYAAWGFYRRLMRDE